MHFPSSSHDHRRCIEEALGAAEILCRDKGVRLTPLRKRVLELVWDSHEPIGAYTLLNRLESEGRSPAPPTIYRALDFLLAQGLVHRLERLNAFVGCPSPTSPHSAQFLICTQCARVAELDDPGIDASVREGAMRLGFSVTAQTIEVEGLCPDCQKKASGDPGRI